LLTSASIQGLATTPNGQFLYGADANGFIYAFSINSATGAPASISGSPFVSGPNYQLVVDPSGKFLYASDLPRSGVRQLGPLYWPNIPEVE
jgi:DNA-binding beta-propeller fold protein YncE